jgi:simple sugar transport system ATP-binding protein
MVHQHFMLVDRLSVTENIIAGKESARGVFLDTRSARDRIVKLSERYGLRVSPDAMVEDISVGEQQRVEILKALYREADILVLDEPTAVLTPQETEELFTIIRRLRDDGKTVILITHKLRETMAISDRVTILRDGGVVGTVRTAETNPNELAAMMVGREVLLRVNKTQNTPGEPILGVEGITAPARTGTGIKNVSFHVRSGEILGIAGVEGNGQLELEEVLLGLRPHSAGNVTFNGVDIGHLETRKRRTSGMAHIPSDRLRRGLVTPFDLSWNFILGSEWLPRFVRFWILKRREIREYGRRLMSDYDIRAATVNAKAANLSGGNQQKLIVARELGGDPQVIVACQPTRGVDVGAIEYIHNRLLDMRAHGKAVLLISAELDEIRSLSDRILVMYEGRIIAERSPDVTEQELGLLMAGNSDPTAPAAESGLWGSTGTAKQETEKQETAGRQ